jgi:O-antigen/teichoic acid export membrane protein
MNFSGAVLQVFIVRVVLIFVNIVSGALIARILGPKGMGILALVFLLKLTVFRFFSFGIGSSIAFLTAKNRLSLVKLKKLTFIHGVSLSAIGCGALFLIKDFAFSPWRLVPEHIFYWALCMVPIFFLNNYISRLLLSKFMISRVNLTEIIRSFIYAIIVIVLFFRQDSSIIQLVFANIFVDSLVLAMLIYFLFKLTEDGKSLSTTAPLDYFKDFIGYGLWNYLTLFIQYAKNSVGIFMFSQFSASTIIGYYNCANGLINKTELLTKPLSQMLFPFNAREEKDKSIERMNFLCRTLLVIMTAFTLVVMLVIKTAIGLIYGNDFLPAVPFFYCLAPLIIFLPQIRLLTVHLAAIGKPKIPAIVNGISVAFMIILCGYFFRFGYSVYLTFCLTAGQLLNMILLFAVYCYDAKQPWRNLLFMRYNDFNILWNIIKKILIKGGLWQKS